MVLPTLISLVNCSLFHLLETRTKWSVPVSEWQHSLYFMAITALEMRFLIKNHYNVATYILVVFFGSVTSDHF